MGEIVYRCKTNIHCILFFSISRDVFRRILFIQIPYPCNLFKSPLNVSVQNIIF